MKFGRYSLVSSHAGTRLPIAAYKAQGAPPQLAAHMRNTFPLSKNLILKECALAHSRAERGCLRHDSSSRECAHIYIIPK